MRNIPLQRMGQPEEVVPAVLCCLESAYMTGQCIAVDGGMEVTA